MNVSREAFKKAFRIKKERNWDRIYCVIDVHETILKPNYEGISDTFYPYAKRVLQKLSKRKDIILIMWTCSKEEDCLYYNNLFLDNGIKFDYINDNPEVKGKLNWGDYDAKMYANVLMDDKANPYVNQEWAGLYFYLEKIENNK